MDNAVIEKIKEILASNKIKNVEVLDLQLKSQLLNAIVVGTFSMSANARMVAGNIKNELEKEFEMEVAIDGEFPGEWIILDMGKVAIELFSEEKRNYYNLEKLWGDKQNKLAKLKLKKRKRM